MKTIGIIGGMSWESSAQYYAIINREIRDRIGAPHSANILMHSLDFGAIEKLQHAGEWDQLGKILADTAQSLERGGADFLVLATNTMHKLADAIEAACNIPLLHIADPTAKSIGAKGLERVGLLGTAFTMEQDFYRGRIEEKFGIDVLIPSELDRAEVHRVIYQELVAGVAAANSRSAYRDVIGRLVERGAQGIVLGCTEIMLLVGPEDSEVPLFDTTSLHAQAAVKFALK